MIELTRRRAIALGVGALAAGPAAAAPSAKLIDPRWRLSGDAAEPEDERLAAFLAEYLVLGQDGVMRVEYARALSEGGDKPLAGWLGAAQAVDPDKLAPAAQRVFWINLYNAATVDLILRYHPVDTIREIEGGLFNTGPWREKILTVNGQRLSLDDVEHGILRPIWPDPLIHYAVNCASIGCPNLMARPWSSATLEADLDAGARAYVNDPRGAEVVDGRLTVSKIYDWFEEDFGDSDAGVISHLKAYAAPELKAKLDGITRISDHRYDWALNGA